MSIKKWIGYVIGPLLFVLIILFADLQPGKPEVTYTLAIALLMAIWWVTEIIPIAVTALLPVVLFPLFGVMNGKDISSAYFNHVIFLFIGGFPFISAFVIEFDFDFGFDFGFGFEEELK